MRIGSPLSVRAAVGGTPTQELIPIVSEDHPDYRQNEAIITEAIRRWNGGTLK